MERPTEQDTSSTVKRVVGILDAFSGERAELSIRELAARSGIPRSTTHRIVVELTEAGLLERGAGGVRLGMRMFEIGAMAPGQRALRDLASPFLHTLHELTGLTANLAIREGRSIVYVDKISARRLRVPHSRLGGRGAMHATALGKAILAFSRPADVDECLDGDLPALTSRTITAPTALRAELAAVRHAGAAYDVEESHLDLFCVAAPVRDASGHAIAAVSVTGATALAQAERFSTTVMATARAIEHQLTRRGRRDSRSGLAGPGRPAQAPSARS